MTDNCVPEDTRTRRRAFSVPCCVLILALAFATTSAHAQVIGLHGIYAPPRGTRDASSGIGTEFGEIFTRGLAVLWPTVGIDYQRQQGLGPGRGRITANLRVARVPDQTAGLSPYVGGSVSANRSGGAKGEWSGTLLGGDAITGLLFRPGGIFAMHLEEQFGYVRGQDHSTSTRLGMFFRY